MLLHLNKRGRQTQSKHILHTAETSDIVITSHYQQEQLLLVPTTGSVPVPNGKLGMLPCQRRVQTALYVPYFTLDMSLGFEPAASDTQDFPWEVQEETAADRKWE